MESTKYLEDLRSAQLEVGRAMRSPPVWTVDAKGLQLKVSIQPAPPNPDHQYLVAS